MSIKQHVKMLHTSYVFSGNNFLAVCYCKAQLVQATEIALTCIDTSYSLHICRHINYTVLYYRLQAEKESQAREEAKRLEEQQRQKLEQIKRRHELQRRQSIDQVEEIKNRRSMEIYSSFKETRKLIEKEAEESCKIIEEEWQEQGKMTDNMLIGSSHSYATLIHCSKF